MERKLARIETVLSLDPIPGADLIEVATIGGWKVVVKKGVFTVSQLAVFFEIDSLLPLKPWSTFLFKDTRTLYRLRTIKLRGQISQGLLVPLPEITELATFSHIAGTDVTDVLGITKWEPNIPANLAGQVKGSFPHFLRKTDEERLQNARDVLDEIRDLPVYVAIKMDGTSFTAYRHEGVFGVCSRNLELREEGGDDYWAIAKKLDLPARLPEGYAISAELCGPGIQGNKMGLAEKDLYVFNVWDIAAQRYLDYERFVAFVFSLGLQTIPVPVTSLFQRPATMEAWLAFADTVKYPNGAQAEGIVVRPVVEIHSRALGGRLSFKVISNAFLMKNFDA
jgi:RNA ligase (TIGR02306 family)